MFLYFLARKAEHEQLRKHCQRNGLDQGHRGWRVRCAEGYARQEQRVRSARVGQTPRRQREWEEQAASEAARAAVGDAKR